MRNVLLIYNDLDQVAHKAVWGLVVPRESRGVSGQWDIVVDGVFKAAWGRVDLKEPREYRAVLDRQDRQDLRVSKESRAVLDRQDRQDLRVSKESREVQDRRESKGFKEV